MLDPVVCNLSSRSDIRTELLLFSLPFLASLNIELTGRELSGAIVLASVELALLGERE